MILLLITSSLIADARPMTEMHGDCSNFEMNVSTELKTWEGTGIPAAASENSKKLPPIVVGSLVNLSMVPETKVQFVAKPEKTFPNSESLRGGLAQLRVPSNGVYKISLGQKVWVDVVDNKGQIIHSKSFEMQTKCPKIFKVVEYDLKSGTAYTLQFSGGQADAAKILVSPKL